MQITELLQFIEWFNKNIIEENLSNKYSTFYDKLYLNVRQGQVSQPFQEEKDTLFETLNSINYQNLSLEQIKFLEKLEIADLLGKQGTIIIDKVLFESNIDIATAAEKIDGFNERINKAISKIKEIETALSDIFEIHEREEVSSDSVLMRIYFQREVSIANLTDFKKLSATWYDIGRGIAMAQDKSPEDFNIIGAKKGSIIIEMAVAVGIATSVSKILLEALKVADRSLDILKKVQELKGLKLSNKKIEQELKKEAIKEKEEGIKSIVDGTIKDFKLNVGQNGDKINALEKSIKKLVDFTENGGLVDFVQPSEEVLEDENAAVRKEAQKLKENIKEIRLLEDKVMLLEEKNKN